MILKVDGILARHSCTTGSVAVVSPCRVEGDGIERRSHVTQYADSGVGGGM
jgi:hypothetical protein